MISKSIQNNLRQLTRESTDKTSSPILSDRSKDKAEMSPTITAALDRDRVEISPAAASNDNNPYAKYSEYGFALSSNERETITEILNRYRRHPRNSETFQAIKTDLVRAGLDPTTLAAKDHVTTVRGRSAVLDEMTGKASDVNVAKLEQQQSEKTRIFWEKLSRVHRELSESSENADLKPVIGR